MNKAKTSGKARKPDDGNVLRVPAKPDADMPALIAQVIMRPSIKAASTVQSYSKAAFGSTDLTKLADELGAQINAVHRGDLQRAEAMLVAQAHTLETMFHELARRAGLNMSEYLNAAEIYLRLALQVQSQCRTTLETLVRMKNPRPAVAFVQQANIVHGPQQVNNAPPAADLRAREVEKAPNELLEMDDGNRSDIGAMLQAAGANPHVEAAGAVDRPTNTRRLDAI